MSDEPETPIAPGTSVIARPFGAESRSRMLNEYFASAGAVTSSNAWQHIYRLLLWIDRTTGLAHCYESDKSQPGRPWYARSLAFHDWVSSALGTSPGDLTDAIDLLFKKATADLASAAAAMRARGGESAAAMRERYEGRGFPLPGEDPELERIITDTLRPWLTGQPTAEALRDLTERIQAHVGQENKRKNLVGEGFEDALAAVCSRVPGIGDRYDVLVRPVLHTLPGFNPPRGREKPRQVDLALVRRTDAWRVLVSAKWSVRSDREEQFTTDFEAYARLEAAGEDFGYVLVTNEFDPARLAAACDNRRQNAALFTDIVHVNPDGPRAAYAAPIPARGGGISRAVEHMESGRLASLESWLVGLAGA